MDLFDELEKMVVNVTHDHADEPQASPENTAVRWKKLFGYSHSKSLELIERHRGNYCRESVSNEHWEIMRGEKETQGYDREAYEHELEIGGRRLKSSSAMVMKGVERDVRRQRYIVKLEQDLTVEFIQEVSRSEERLEVIDGRGQDGAERFCVVSSRTKQALLQRLSFEPTFIRIDEAEKRLSRVSKYPTLGIDTTLPQFRPNNCEGPFLPAQDEYPVWYFFYGTLADSTVLTQQLSLTEEPELYPATYHALLNGPDNGKVQGCAFQVLTKELEDALRIYETRNYEVVRCVIEFDQKIVQGCTFRFVGHVDR
ncbi:hypothetical protein N431DRAFT_542612 [Stipitochalara longipes BDJ]|nr:hypothetical protein N431DRAFT_542612 [Stipitochalara longipes BDJ]